MQEFFNWISNIPNYILNIGKAIYAHIEFISNTNTIFELVISSSAILLFIYNGLKFINGYRAKSLLKIYLSKDELKNLKYYVTTYAQLKPPADILRHSKRFNLIKFFIKDIFQKDKHGKFFIVLGESGMGKSTFLQKLFLKYKRTFFRRHEIYFYPLSNEVDIGEWKQIKNKHNSILLLDALDEDSYAVNDYKKRIDQITMASHEFYKVVITCRTHFFPDEESEPKNIPLIRYGTHNKKLEFYKVYISNFNGHDINKYLIKRYKFHVLKIIQAKKIINKCFDVIARPLLLSYIDDLIKGHDIYSSRIEIYEKLIHEWLNREPCSEELLKQFSTRVLRYMLKHNVSYITSEAISTLCKKDEIEIINPILARTRSLLTRNIKGEYKFAHKSIYEYMLVYEVVYNDTGLRPVLLDYWYDIAPHGFYQEMSIAYAVKNNDNLSFLHLMGCDMSSISFSNKNLTGANLTHTYLVNTDLINANLRNADLASANLIYADLTGANLTNANLAGASLTNANLAKANLTGANLTNADLTGTDLTYADLTKANLTGTNLIDAILIGTKLKNSILKKLILNNTVFYSIKIEDVNIDKYISRYIHTQNEYSEEFTP